MAEDLIARTENYTKHFCATAYVTNQNHTKMLLTYHRKLGHWAPPGGHIEKNETPTDAAIRETLEETGAHVELVDKFTHDVHAKGITDAQLPTPYAIFYQLIPETPKEGAAHIHVDFCYEFAADDRDPIVAQQSESKGVRWVSRAEILRDDFDAFDSVKEFAKNFLIG